MFATRRHANLSVLYSTLVMTSYQLNEVTCTCFHLNLQFVSIKFQPFLNRMIWEMRVYFLKLKYNLHRFITLKHFLAKNCTNFVKPYCLTSLRCFRYEILSRLNYAFLSNVCKTTVVSLFITLVLHICRE